MKTEVHFEWIDFYMELADKLLLYKNDRKRLVKKVKSVYSAINMQLPKLDKNNILVDIDPFTIFGLFNKGITNANRIAILQGFAQEFFVKAAVPETFDGIPVLNNMSATFYRFIEERGENDIENLWKLFAYALEYSETHLDYSKRAFIEAYDFVMRQKGIKWNLTMALYWIRPYEYINLDSRNRWFICNPENMPADYIESIGALGTVPTGAEYLAIVDKSRDILKKGSYEYKSFPELSNFAWIISEQVNEENRAAMAEGGAADADDAIGDNDVDDVHYWIYSPGYKSAMWDKFYEDGVMAIAREYMGDLRQYASKKEIQNRMIERGGDTDTSSCKNAALEAWQFVHELMPGDVIFAKKGKHSIIGRGVVTSDYYYDESYSDEYRNLRKVKWTHKGEWEHPWNAITKMLTDITPYTRYVGNIIALFGDDPYEDNEEETNEEETNDYPSYTAEDFLNEVYMSRTDYDNLSGLLSKKMNIILQGPPGVGKTFAAERLAYSMMGVKDLNRVMMVQFHQSYSYEDFIMGFRPASTGFELKTGPFYSFCKKAELDPENDYYFIIDEINRGNLSKIFGELFMLVENDKRGKSVQLLYSDESFSVPKNLYIIGMMNTADRSLAMLDYALRRRFAFFELSPAFETEGFRRYRRKKNNKKFDRLIATVEKLNTAIDNDETLGKGFRIGHSFFCIDEEIDDMWLNAVITYEIVPLLNEYWFDEVSKVRDWENALREAIQ